MKFLRIFPLLVAATTIAQVTPAFAADNATLNGHAGASTDDGGVIITAGSSDTSPGQENYKGSAPVCTWSDQDPEAPPGTLLDFPPPPGAQTPGKWMVKHCPDGILPMQWIPDPPQMVAPVSVARDALAQLTLPTPVTHTTPSSNMDQLVHVPTWLWVDGFNWSSLSATASVAGVSATATATPIEVLWDMGDGHQILCHDAGTPYDPSKADANQSTDCSYAWPQSSAGQPNSTFMVTATVYWHATWTAIGVPGGGDLGQIASPPTTVAMRVAEVQAINGQPGA